MQPPRSGYASSEFVVHLIAIIAGSGAFWELLQQYLPMAQQLLGGNSAMAAILPIAASFLGLMVLIAHTAAKYSSGRVELKSAAIEAGQVAAAAVTTPAQAADILGAAGKAVALLLVFGLLLPRMAWAADPAPAMDHATVTSCTTDAGALVPHGVWLSDVQAVREAKELVQLRAENAQLHLEPQVLAWEVVGGAVLVLAGGFTAGWLLHRS